VATGDGIMFDNRVEDEGAERVGGIGITELTEGTGVDGKAEFGDVVGPELFDPPPAATPATAPATAAPAAAPAASPAPTLIPAAPFTPAAAPAAPASAFPESSLPGPASLGGPVGFGVSMLFERKKPTSTWTLLSLSQLRLMSWMSSPCCLAWRSSMSSVAFFFCRHWLCRTGPRRQAQCSW